jgi:hypothetical protein
VGIKVIIEVTDSQITRQPRTVHEESDRHAVNWLEFCGFLEEFPLLLTHALTFLSNSGTISCLDRGLAAEHRKGHLGAIVFPQALAQPTATPG